MKINLKIIFSLFQTLDALYLAKSKYFKSNHKVIRKPTHLNLTQKENHLFFVNEQNRAQIRIKR